MKGQIKGQDMINGRQLEILRRGSCLNYTSEETKQQLFDKILKVKSLIGNGNPNTVTTAEMLDCVLDFTSQLSQKFTLLVENWII